MATLNRGDLIGGAALCAIGAVGAVNSIQYELGDFQRMGPGLYPLILSVCLVVMSLVIMAFAFKREDETYDIKWKNLLVVVASLVFFGLTVRFLGALLSVFASVLIASMLSRFSLIGRIGLAATLSLLTGILFVQVLGVSMDMLPRGLGL